MQQNNTWPKYDNGINQKEKRAEMYEMLSTSCHIAIIHELRSIIHIVEYLLPTCWPCNGPTRSSGVYLRLYAVMFYDPTTRWSQFVRRNLLNLTWIAFFCQPNEELVVNNKLQKTSTNKDLICSLHDILLGKQNVVNLLKVNDRVGFNANTNSVWWQSSSSLKAKLVLYII